MNLRKTLMYIFQPTKFGDTYRSCMKCEFCTADGFCKNPKCDQIFTDPMMEEVHVQRTLRKARKYICGKRGRFFKKPLISSHFTLLQNILPEMVASEIVGVQPMTKKTASFFKLEYRPNERVRKLIKTVWLKTPVKFKSEKEYSYHEIPMEMLDIVANSDTVDIIRHDYKKGDTILIYKSPQWTWSSLCGRAGIMVIRKKMIVANLGLWIS